VLFRSLNREAAPIEFIDPANSLSASRPGASSSPFVTSRPVSLPETDKIFFQALTLAPADTKLDSPEKVDQLLSAANIMVVFDPLGQAASLRSRLTTEILVLVECSEADWKLLPKGKLDTTHIDVWDEFVKTYHMITSDVRPPFWNDSHRLMIVKQGWVPYTSETESLEWTQRLVYRLDPVPIDRHEVNSAYAQEGQFRFDRSQADDLMRRYFAAGAPVPLGRETLSGALKATDVHRSGKTAIIECTIALEVAVAEVVAQAKLKLGVSKKKLDEYKKEVGLGYQLNVDLPMILAPLADSDRQLIGAADAVRKRRNEIIHQGAQATQEEGSQAVAAVRALLDLLRSRGHTV
jgi:hypothetical protein